MANTTGDRAAFPCPYCSSGDVYRVTATDGTYECYTCGERTHEKIEEHREDLEDLAASDNASSKLAKLLTEPTHD